MLYIILLMNLTAIGAWGFAEFCYTHMKYKTKWTLFTMWLARTLTVTLFLVSVAYLVRFPQG